MAANPPQITRLAAYGVIRRGDRILHFRVAPGNLGEGLWTLPGGGLNFGEAPDAGAIREVEEETGLAAEITGSPVVDSDAGTWQRSGGPARYHHVRFVDPMRVLGGEERHEVDGSTDAFASVPIDEVAQLDVGDLVPRTLAGLSGPGSER